MSQFTCKRRHWAVTAPAVVGIAYSTAWIVALAISPSSLSVNGSRAQVMTAYAGHEGVAIVQYALAQGVAAAALAAVVIALDQKARRAGGPVRRHGALPRQLRRVAGVVARGSVTIETASGGLAIGVREGAAAWIDAVTKFGRVHNNLTSADDPEPSAETVQVRARTQFGDVLIARSSVPNRQGDT